MTTYDDTILYDANIPYDGAVAVPLDVFAALDVYHLIIPEEQTQYETRYSTVNLVDEDGDQLVDEDGNDLVAVIVTTETVYVVYAPQDRYTLIVDEEMPDIFINPDDLSLTVPEET